MLTCSALKRSYRDILRGAAPGLRFVHLALSQQQALQRVAERGGHFYPPSLVASQFAALEDPAGEPGRAGAQRRPAPGRGDAASGRLVAPARDLAAARCVRQGAWLTSPFAFRARTGRPPCPKPSPARPTWPTRKSLSSSSAPIAGPTPPRATRTRASIIGDKFIMVSDATATPAMAQDLIARIRTVSNKPIKYVLLTHYHAVRVLGASAYAAEGATEIIASQGTLRADRRARQGGHAVRDGALPAPVPQRRKRARA